MKKKILSVLLVSVLFAVSIGGCGNESLEQKEVPVQNEQTENDGSVEPEEEEPWETEQETSDTRTVTDSVGREVTIPASLDRVAPSGALAQIMMYTIAPDQVIGWSAEFTELQKKYIEEKYWSLPVFGQFYGKNVSLNMEALVASKPDVIIDIGQAKKTMKEDMDALQEQLGIPVIFIEATLDTMSQAYLTLGNLTGHEEKAQQLSDYCIQTLADAKEKSESISEEARVKVYYGQGDKALEAITKGTIHADVIDYVGGNNVAESDLSGGQGGTVSMEQILIWDPEVVLLVPEGIKDSVVDNEEWQEVTAVKNGNVFEVPDGPYNWMGRPPSVNRLIGIKWLGNLLYPEVFDYDMVKETKEFYQLFYHYEISDAEVENLLGK